MIMNDPHDLHHDHDDHLDHCDVHHHQEQRTYVFISITVNCTSATQY